MLNLIAIQSDKGFYVGLGTKPSGWYNHEYLYNKLYDGVKPQKVSHMESQPNINYRFVLTDDTLAGKLKSELTREEAGSVQKTCDGEKFIWKDELAMYRSLYVEVSDPQPDKEVVEEFDFTVIFKIPEVLAPAEMNYPINERYLPYTSDKKVTDYLTNTQVEHQVLDKIIFPTLILPQTPSRLSSKQSYQIIREHVKRNIDPKVARITSDFDFCFAVAKVVGLAEPYETEQTIRDRRRKPVINKRLVSVREVQVFEMTNDQDNYKGYTPIHGFEAENETALKEQIDDYLSELMERINEPLVDCPTCKGRGVVLQGVKVHA